jgi:hypothetical protein
VVGEGIKMNEVKMNKLVKYSEIVKSMKESEWTRDRYVDYDGKKCILGYLISKVFNIDTITEIWDKCHNMPNNLGVKMGDLFTLIDINDEAKNFTEAKTKSVEFLESLNK